MIGKKKILALCGGVGGAKLALGLSHILSPDQLTVVVNTADDFEHFGLPICPDLDTVMYTLAGVNNSEQGWGREGESWNCFDSLKALNAETWFQLGDKDLAVHLSRRALLDQGLTLSETMAVLYRQFEISHPVVPMTDSVVSTVVSTDQGDLSFQHYFVREQCRPVITGYHFKGIEKAVLSEGFSQALDDPDLGAVIICPSNPFVSVSPILDIPGVRERITQNQLPVIAVSPIVGGKALKGPAAKMFTELNLPCNSAGVADFYGDLLTALVVDKSDQGLDEATKMSCHFHYCNTVMKTLEDRIALAQECINLI